MARIMSNATIKIKIDKPIRPLCFVCLSKNNKTIERIANKIVNPAKIKLLLLKKDEMLLDTFIATVN